ncbi:MAG: glycosyltransferase family 2 protein [Ruminococcus sp.]|uniref:glycosyltransferase family 2 protein n=1 Tax=Ruminococcus sp. TaxID=41978 RepID=UPI0025DD746E|nr:glycosyltransferase family 2 protein [Ruminococcus sp.]MCR4796206.1 glycosyltransferase family 2 protein [Ruminococcus sp.]
MKIAVLLATYNSENYVGELLDSLLDQTFQDFVCYVHDDGSKDKTLDVVREYSSKNPGKFIILDYPSTGSSKANFLSMLKYVKEPYAMFCDHDDVWCSDKIEVSYKSMLKMEQKYPETPVMCFGDMKVVDSHLKEMYPSFFRYTGLDPHRTELRQLLVENVVAGCTVIMNKKLYDAVLKLKSYDNIQMHDLWVALVASAIGKIYYIDKGLLLYRQHESNVVGAEKNISFAKRVKLVLDRLVSREYVKKTKKWHSMFRSQAYELSELPEVPEKTREFLRQFCELKNKNKLSRIMFYKKHHIERRKNNFWFLLWC